MSQVKRLYVEKKPSYAVKAKELAEELKAYLSIDDVSNVRVLIRYDVENVSAETMEKAAVTVFSEPPVDDLYEEDFPKKEGDLEPIMTEAAGIFIKKAECGQEVSRGDVLAQIMKADSGEIISEVKAPTDGIIFYAETRPVVYSNLLVFQIIKRIHL